MSRKKNTIALLALFLGLSLTADGNAQELRKEGRYWVGEVHKNFKVKKGGTLEMDDVRGDVIIQTWGKNEVDIHELKKMDIFTKSEAEAAMEESEIGYVQQGNTIRIGGPAFDREWIRSKFKILVPVEFNCDIETKGGDLSVTGIKGSVEASTGGGDIILKEIDGPADTKTGGGDIEITKTTKKVIAKTGGGDVTVSRTKDRVYVRTGGGDVEIRETQGDVEIMTGGGEIQIVDASGDVDVKTGGGEIDIRNVTGNFRAVTGGGDIDARSVKGTLTVKTGGGDIELEDIQGAVEVATGGGDVSAEITLKDFSIDHHVDIKTGGGDIDLTIPEKLPATIQAEIKFRRRSWEDYEITSDFPLKRTTDDESSRYRIIRATGDINGGGDLIRLKTGGGDIRIRKLRR